MVVSQTVLGFDDLDGFVEDWAEVVSGAPLLGFVCGYGFGEGGHRSEAHSSHHIRAHTTT